MTHDPAALYERACQHAHETGLLCSVEALLGWDERTQLPFAAGEYRAEQMTLLSGIVHKRQTDPAYGEWLAELAASPLTADPTSDAAVTVRQLKRKFDKRTKLPLALVEELTRTSVRAQQAWVEARKANDFASFRPWLEKIFDLKRQEADALGYVECRYDALLDDYEPGEITSNVTRVLSGLREELVGLAGAIRDCDRKPDATILSRHYPVAAQREFAQYAASKIGFDFARGRLDVTAHPFCSEMGPHDMHITTRYDERFFPAAFFGTLHEAGHGMYEQGLRPEFYGLPPGQHVSMGIHESQSRMWENVVGRSAAFWEHFYPAAQRAFPAALGDISREAFQFAVNDVRPSLIRVEADEVTYNLHIIIRFELEQALLSGDLAVADLPGAWNEKYRQYLGTATPTDADGVLQDIHWSAGLVGYFPTYSLGNLYAAQFFAQAEMELGNQSERFARGEFQPLLDWLREKIHRPGMRFTASELVQHVTGRALSHADLINYLLNKLEPLYSGPAPTTTSETIEVASASATLQSSDAAIIVGGETTAEEAVTVSTLDLEPLAEALEGAVPPAEPTAAESFETAVANHEALEDRTPASYEYQMSPLATSDVVAGGDERERWPAGGLDLGLSASGAGAAARSQPHPIGFVGNLIGMAVFGIVGLGLGYWLLNFFGGPRFNFLEIWLPFVAHTH